MPVLVRNWLGVLLAQSSRRFVIQIVSSIIKSWMVPGRPKRVPVDGRWVRRTAAGARETMPQRVDK